MKYRYYVKSWDDRWQTYEYMTMTLDKVYKVGQAFWIKNRRYEIVEVYEQ